MPRPMWTRYVAIGDSTTEGLDDPRGDGTYRGWADRLAHRIAAVQGGLEYANLAIRGRETRRILEEQLAPAVELRPDLATVVAGMNDLLRPRFAAATVAADVEEMFRALRSLGTTVVTFTLPAPGPGMPLARLLRPRVLRFNRELLRAAERTGTRVLDLGAHPVASDPRLWSHDRLHANSLGHARTADGLGYVLGVPGSDLSWSEPLPAMRPRPLHRAVRDDVAWARTHLAPWVVRHLRGVSSGDGLSPKRPLPLPVSE